ncbi:MAG: 30S ribosomal protein S6 [Candidatus Desulfofervidaceae bacterium]|nr:30S ribosomal protein S6 [Candidatus Desulfofervidaceae bacterium]MDL1969797.1 30S ribosomal protein S6 [Candidatus Desulfofervidaceae bacterium]
MKVREYETVIVADPELSEEQIEELFTKFGNIIARHEGILKEVEKWGVRDLAFKVNHKRKGYYAILHYYGGSELVNEIERNIKIDDRIIRFLTIKVSKKDIDRSQVETQAA